MEDKNKMLKEVYIIPISPTLKISTTIYDGKNGKRYFSFRFSNIYSNGSWKLDKIKGISVEFKYWGEFERAFKALQKEMIDNHLEELDNPK